MKKALVLLSVLLLLSALAGCGINKKISEEVSEQIAEGILGEAGKGKVDVDIEDGKIKFKGEDGSEMTIGEDKWPQGGAADQIPGICERQDCFRKQLRQGGNDSNWRGR